MDFKNLFFGFIASFLIVFKRVLWLALYPYKTMRKISLENDLTQPFILLIFVFIYFQFANRLREFPYDPLILFLMSFVHFFLSVLFFYFFGQLFHKNLSLNTFIITFSYTLIPTLIWFFANSALYQIFPPPRTMSVLGKTFSIVYISFSISMLVWKIILWYLAIRFSTKFAFYRILYLMLLYACVLAPYTVVLYSFRMFRVPFI